MKKIGIDKRDPEYRHFYYDDNEILYSNPQKFKVTYIDNENDIDYIDCSYVIKIKDVPGFVEEPVVQNIVGDTVEKTVEEEPKVEVKQEHAKPKVEKKRGRKKKEKEIADVEEIVDAEKNPVEAKLDTSMIKNNKYEYIVVDLSFSSSDILKDSLNEYGEMGWNLCSTELYSDGLFGGKKILCIFKRIKGLE